MSAPKHTWKVEDGRFVLPDGSGMTASCHHRKSGACGGCYARANQALEAVLISEDPRSVVTAVRAEMISEGRDIKAVVR